VARIHAQASNQLGAPLSLWTRITGAFRPERVKILRPGVTADGVRITGKLSILDQFTRIGGGITPTSLSNYIRQADQGEPQGMIDLLNEFRQKVWHLQAVLEARESAISELPWSVPPVIEPGETEANESNSEVAASIEHMLRQSVAPLDTDDDVMGFSELLEHLQGGLYYGHAGAETLFGMSDGLQVPVGYVGISARRWKFHADDSRILHWDPSMGHTGRGIDVRAEHPGKFIIHRPRVTGDVGTREGYGRVLLWACLSFTWTMADWWRFAELAWKPWRLGKYSRDTRPEDIVVLREALERLTTNGVAILPDTVDLTLNIPSGKSGGTRSDHERLASFLIAEISKVVLGGTLTMESGDRGARSLGEVHERGLGAKTSRDSRFVGGTLMRDLIAHLVHLNYPGAPIPALHFSTEDAKDLLATAQAIKILKEAKFKIPVSWIHDETGIPEPGEGDEVLGEGEDDEPDEDPPGTEPPVDPGAEPEPEPEPLPEPAKAA